VKASGDKVLDLIDLVEQDINERRLLRPRQNVLVAVSGGLDSMVLLYALNQLSKEHRWKLAVAHFNHQLRGRSSDADERLVRRTTERMGWHFFADRADVKRFAARARISLEMAARQLRHDFLARTARKGNIGVVALGHHTDDQVELFFLRLLRGAGVEGLAGMKWSSPSSSDSKIMLVRPLLGRSRKEIAHFARTKKIRFREDSTNTALDFLRNRFRHEMLPLLVKHYQPALAKTTLRLMQVLEAESEFVSQSAASWLENRQPAFAQLPVAIQRRTLQLQLFRLGLTPDFERIEHLRLRPDLPLTLSPGLRVLRDNAGLLKLDRTAEQTFDNAWLDLTLTGKKGTARYGRLKITWRIQAQKHGNHHGTPPSVSIPCTQRRDTGSAKGSFQESFDADKVGSTIALRHWQPGDRFQPIGMHTSVKLQDLFSNQKVPREQRHQLVVAAEQSGELFWVEGLRISERFKLDKNTVRSLIWHWRST